MTDLKLNPGPFSTTSVLVVGFSEKGQRFLQSIVGSNLDGIQSVTIPKTRGFDLMRFAEQKGLIVEII